MTGFTMDHKKKTTGQTSAIFIDMCSIDELVAGENHVGAKSERVRKSEKVRTSKRGGIGFNRFFLVAFKTSESQGSKLFSTEAFNSRKKSRSLLIGSNQMLALRMIIVQRVETWFKNVEISTPQLKCTKRPHQRTSILIRSK